MISAAKILILEAIALKQDSWTRVYEFNGMLHINSINSFITQIKHFNNQSHCNRKTNIHTDYEANGWQIRIDLYAYKWMP